MTMLPAMPPEQTASWFGPLDLYERLDTVWTLIGGQFVHLHGAERGQFSVRPTNDADTVIDVRADPKIPHTVTKSPIGVVSERSSRRSTRTTNCFWNFRCSVIDESPLHPARLG